MIQDQAGLADIAKRPSASVGAVEGIADQTLLADVAQKAYSGGIRLAAAKKLTDKALAQTIYADIAENGHWQQIDEAVTLLTDQGLLAEVAKSGTTGRVRLQVAEKLTDKALAQRVFADIAKNGEPIYGVVERIIDQAMLADVAQKGYVGIVRLAAAEKLTDQKLLEKIALTGSDAEVRIAAAARLTDNALAQRIFADIAIAEPWGRETGPSDGSYYKAEAGEKAFWKITDMHLLGEVAATAKDELVRMAAAKKVMANN